MVDESGKELENQNKFDLKDPLSCFDFRIFFLSWSKSGFKIETSYHNGKRTLLTWISSDVKVTGLAFSRSAGDFGKADFIIEQKPSGKFPGILQISTPFLSSFIIFLTCYETILSIYNTLDYFVLQQSIQYCCPRKW